MPNARKIRTDHALGLLANLDKFRLSDWECDYEIKSESQTFRVHKSVLAGCSTALQSMVETNRYRGSFEIGAEATKQVIKFMYSGTAEVTEYNFQDFMHAARVYQLDGLKALCMNYIEQDLNVENCFQRLRKSTVYRLDNSTKVIKYIKDHFTEVMATNGFKNLTQMELSMRIKDLQLPSHQIWQGISAWVQHETTRESDMARLVQENLERFLPDTILNEILQSDIVSRSDRCKELLLVHVLLNPARFKSAINAGNCFKLSKLCASSPHSNTILFQNDIVEFMIENFMAIEDNEEIVELPIEGVVALCEGMKQKNIRGEKIWKLALKWTKHRLGERQDAFPRLFSFVNLNDFPYQFVEQVIRNEELVQESRPCYQSVMDYAFNQGAFKTPEQKPNIETLSKMSSQTKDHASKQQKPTYETPKKKPRKETLSSKPSTSASYIGEKTKHRPYIVVYAKHSGNVVGFDLSTKEEPKSGKKTSIKKNISKFKVVADDFQCAFTLKEDLYVLKGAELKVYRQAGTKKSWVGRKSLDKKPTSDAKIVTFQGRLHIVETGCLIIYDPDSDCWLHRLIPEIRGRKFAVCANSTHLYILGGDMNPQMALEYNPTALNAKEITSTIYPRADASAVSVGEIIYLLGGDNHLAQRSMESYKPSKHCWTRMNAEMEFSRWSFSVCAYNGKIYAVGGKKNASSKDSIEVYDTMDSDSKWAKFCDIPTFQPPYNACVVRLTDDEETTPMEVGSPSHV